MDIVRHLAACPLGSPRLSRLPRFHECGIMTRMNKVPLKVWVQGLDGATQEALRGLGFAVSVGQAGDEAAADAKDHDAVLWWAADAAALHHLIAMPELPASALERAWVVCTPLDDPALEEALVQRGVEALTALLPPAQMARTLRQAVHRKRLERAARTAYATDLATGLPHQAQLVEHMTQLLALREREPAPMVLLVLRMTGFEQAAARLGAEAGNVLRRKVAVRLRAGLRASDVVASMDANSFGVLLGRLEAKADGERVAAKLVQALQQPIQVAGQPCRVSAAVGLALYPEHGKDVESLLQRASAQAGSVVTLGRSGFGGSVQRSGGVAANDEDSAPG